MDLVTKLDILQIHVTQFRFEYWKLQGQDILESLYKMTKGQITSLLKLHHELVIKRGMSYEATANIVDLALCKLPYMEPLYEQANEEESRKQDGVDYLENRKYSLKKEISSLEEEKRKRISASYYYEHNETNRLQPLPSSYSLLGLPDLSTL